MADIVAAAEDGVAEVAGMAGSVAASFLHAAKQATREGATSAPAEGEARREATASGEREE